MRRPLPTRRGFARHRDFAHLGEGDGRLYEGVSDRVHKRLGGGAPWYRDWDLLDRTEGWWGGAWMSVVCESPALGAARSGEGVTDCGRN